MQCRYSNYGTHCQQDCSHCEKEECDIKIGCVTTDINPKGSLKYFRKNDNVNEYLQCGQS